MEIKNILVVNDNPIRLAFFEKMLKKPGINVELCGAPYAYIKEGGSIKPDLIILDRKYGKINILDNDGYKEFLKIAPTILTSSSMPLESQTKETIKDLINKGLYGLANDEPEPLDTMLKKIELQRRDCEGL